MNIQLAFPGKEGTRCKKTKTNRVQVISLLSVISNVCLGVTALSYSFHLLMNFVDVKGEFQNKIV